MYMKTNNGGQRGKLWVSNGFTEFSLADSQSVGQPKVFVFRQTGR